jgi:hypothetical protein
LENYADIFGSSYVGGIFGYFNSDSNSSRIRKNLLNEGNVYGTISVGGIAGEITRSGSNFTPEVSKVINKGNINSFPQRYMSSLSFYNSISRVGGIFGLQVAIKLSEAVNLGNVISLNSGSQSYSIGGISGRKNEGSIINSYNAGLVSATNTGTNNSTIQGVGGLIGNGASVSLGYVFNTGAVIGRTNVGGLVGFAETSFYVYYAINFGDVVSSIATTNIGSILGSPLPSSNDFEQLYYTNTNTSNGVVVDGIAYGSKVTNLALLDEAFFTTMLEWSTDTWSFEGLDIANGVYPELKFILPVEEEN